MGDNGDPCGIPVLVSIQSLSCPQRIISVFGLSTYLDTPLVFHAPLWSTLLQLRPRQTVPAQVILCLPYKLGYKTPPLIRPVSFIRPFPRISFHQNRFIRPGLISNLLRSVRSLPLTAGEIKEVMDRGVAASW